MGGGHDLVGNRTLVQGTRPVERDALQCPGVFGIAKQVALLDGIAVGAREQRAHLVGGWKGRSLAEKHRQPRWHLEARRRGTNRRLEELLPAQRAELGMCGVQHGDGARHARGASAAHRYHKRQRLAVLVQKHVGLRARGRALAAIDGAHLARVRVVVQEECAAADPGALRLDESEHRLHGNGGIDRVAPLAQNLKSGLDGQRIGGRDPRRLRAARVAMEQGDPSGRRRSRWRCHRSGRQRLGRGRKGWLRRRGLLRRRGRLRRRGLLRLSLIVACRRWRLIGRRGRPRCRARRCAAGCGRRVRTHRQRGRGQQRQRSQERQGEESVQHPDHVTWCENPQTPVARRPRRRSLPPR